MNETAPKPRPIPPHASTVPPATRLEQAARIGCGLVVHLDSELALLRIAKRQNPAFADVPITLRPARVPAEAA